MADSRVEKAAEAPGWTEAEYTPAVGRLHAYALDLKADLAAAEKALAAAQPKIEWQAQMADLAAEVERLEFNNSSLRMERDAIDHNRKLDNQTLLDRAEAAEAGLKQAREAITNASYCLDPNQGERPNAVEAYKWLRTTYPKDHPNYVDPSSLPPGFTALSSSGGEVEDV